ncbi:DUF2384 domain-containing protein [Zooshikella marina]|uniref:type II RES/Xre toxin-antitoxin system antitoxin n=1 Tax=Zooshikella ganghwensis TaxID=202772 RepID=UPI001BAF4081|nr:antitoxin Xre-like helix-turn-helix domain-containing protein [Zooshikella ganghwensis]MBU2708857.1 DUF2384 domain-containing protein [Zooshikella ganghwensis]
MSISNDTLKTIGVTKPPLSVNDEIGLIRLGIPASAVDKLSAKMKLSKGEMAGIIGVSTRTLSRLKAKRLEPHQSEHLLAIASLFTQGIDYFGDETVFLDWLNSEHPALGGKPFDYLDTITGIQFVKEKLSRMAYGDIA